MTKSLRRVAAILSAWCGIIVLGAVVAQALEPVPQINPIEWSELATFEKLDRLKVYPPQHRAMLVEQLNPADQAAVWTEHFTRWLAPETGLSAEQREVVADHLPLLTTESFGEQRPETTMEAARALCVRVDGAFEITLKDGLLSPGSAPGVPINMQAARLNFEPRWKRTIRDVANHYLIAFPVQAFNCNCSNVGCACDFLPYPEGFGCASGNCSYVSIGCGCGPYRPYGCDGYCAWAH